MMSNILIIATILSGQVIIGFVFFKLLPSAITMYVEKGIERASDIKLEKAKADIQGAYATLKTSVDLLSASNSGLHPHIIAAVTDMWGLMVDMRHTFSGIVTFDSVTLVEEAKEAFNENGRHKNFLNFLEEYADEKKNFDKYGCFFASELDSHRLFCGDRLWLIFFVTRAYLLRCALLVSRSYKTEKFVDWRDDKVIRSQLLNVLPADMVEKALSARIGGIAMVTGQLEAAFLHEATRVMSGSKTMSDSLADVQAILLLQNAEVSEHPNA